MSKVDVDGDGEAQVHAAPDLQPQLGSKEMLSQPPRGKNKWQSRIDFYCTYDCYVDRTARYENILLYLLYDPAVRLAT